MNDQDLVQSLSFTGKARATLYLSTAKVEQLYVQTVAQVTEFVRSAQEGGKFSASLFRIFGGEISDQQTLATKILLSPALQAILIENAAARSREIINLASHDAKEGTLLRHVGEGHITMMAEPILAETVGLPVNSCAVIERERQEQERILRFKDDQVRTVVLTFSTRRGVLASIASTESIDLNLLASYRRHPPFGILCRKEQTIADIIFVSPIWIWHEGW